MPYVTKDQIASAKSVGILDYLQRHEPHNLRHTGNEHRLVDHDSLKISNGKWHWFSRGIGGRTALDFLIKVREMPFTEAVELLSGERSISPPARYSLPSCRSHSKPFALPAPHTDNDAVIAYLQGRGIAMNLISQCIEQGNLYESAEHHNCVFVGRDDTGTPRYASLRGTRDVYRQDVDGSKKEYGFQLAGAESSDTVMVFESPIDALSLATIRNAPGREDLCHYLSLGGVSPLALKHFLTVSPQVSTVYLCLDNDETGLKGMTKIRDEFGKLAVFSHVLFFNNPPHASKDYNEYLTLIPTQTQCGRPKYRAAAGISR